MQKPSPVHRLLTLAALLAALPAAAAPDVTDLGTLKNDNSGGSRAKAINSDGSQVFGHAFNDNGEERAVVWSGSNWANKTDLGTLKADNSGNSEANAVSGDGLVVGGTARNDNGEGRGIIWSGSNWTTKTELGTLKADNSGGASVSALSSDGSVAVGGADNDRSSLLRPIVWSGSNWGTKTDLGTLDSSNSLDGIAYAVSDDGSIVVGSVGSDIAYSRAIVWSGSNWATKTDLGTLKNDNTGFSTANAVSGDGSLVFGFADNDNGEQHATAWSGSGWAAKTDLGTLKSDNSGNSYAQAASGDGSVVGGYAEKDNGESHAIVWSGSGWTTKTDLGTLKTDNSGNSLVYGISADGNFAVGQADNDNGDYRAAVWNLRGGRAADTANTRASLSLLSADTAAMLAHRARTAQTLLDTCRADGGKFCYSAGYTHDVGHGARSRGARFAFGYGFTDNFDAAVSLAVPARAEENGSHRLKSGVGIGLSARLHNGAGWYAVPAAAFETDKTRIRRPHLDGTESPENTVRTKGRAYSLTAGRDYGTSGEKTLGWYAALRRTEVERPSYSEDASLSFPFAYGAAKLKETSLAAGIKGRLPLTGKLAWYGNAEVAQRVGGGKARFTAEAPFFGKYETERETSRTRPSVQTGVDYAFSPSAVLSLGGYVGRNAFSGTDKGMFLKLNGKF
ncbi:hypothetical protein HMPREF3107_09435 [Neisseria sp. HMSC31F04]|nr:hypothetical protein HMPREF3107_09435 [Neisseria sp. HMSC31F04]